MNGENEKNVKNEKNAQRFSGLSSSSDNSAREQSDLSRRMAHLSMSGESMDSFTSKR